MMKLILGVLLMCAAGAYTADSDCQKDVEVVCYWGSWSIYRLEIGEFTTENIDPSLCTIMIYTFTGLGLNFEVESLDTWADFDRKGFANFTAFKESNPCLKTNVAIGGWNEGSRKYSVMASTEEGRKQFAENVLKFLAYYNFDGLDLDWEYPTQRGGITADGDNYAALLKVIKETISPWGLILSIAVPIDDNLIGTAYDVPAIAEVVDYVHLMAYDYVPSTSKVTGLSAPLPAIKQTVSNWLNAGLPSKKLILGIPSYGRNFILEYPSKNGIGAPVANLGLPGLYTAEEGFLAYYEVLDIIKGADMQEVEAEDTNYAFVDDEWITYETTKSVKTKVQFAIDQKLGGLMLWSLDTDDFRGIYGQRYPLLSTIHDVIAANK